MAGPAARLRSVARRLGARRALTALRALAGRRGPRAGVALGPSGLTAVASRSRLGTPGPDAVLRHPLDGGPRGDRWPGLAEALEELGERLGDGASRGRLDVALLPPLARVRAVRLPAARRRELRRLVQREITRHFLDAPADPVADAAPSGRSGDRTPCVAVCGSRPTVAAVASAARDAGWTLGLVTGGDWTAAEAAVRLEPKLRRGRSTLELERDGRVVAIEMRRGRLRRVRPRAYRVPGDAVASPPVRAGPEGGGPRGLSADALAAFGATVSPEDGPSLAPGDVLEAQRRRFRIRAGLLGALAVALVATAAGLHLWGLDREIAALESLRARRADRVERTLAAREAAATLGRILGSASAVSARGPGWSGLLAEIGRRLPASAYLESFASSEGALVLTGRARSPSALVPALESSPRVERAALATVARTDSPGVDGFRLELELAGPPMAVGRPGTSSAPAAARPPRDGPASPAPGRRLRVGTGPGGRP